MINLVKSYQTKDKVLDMGGRAHLAMGVFAGWLIIYAVNPAPAEAVTVMGAATLGSVMPDIDSRLSKIGKVLPKTSFLVNSYIGHRTLVHSPLFLGALWLIVGRNLTGVGFLAGYAGHLIQDLCTKGGIPLFYPNRLRFSLLPFKSGGLADGFVTLVLMVVIMYTSLYLYTNLTINPLALVVSKYVMLAILIYCSIKYLMRLRITSGKEVVHSCKYLVTLYPYRSNLFSEKLLERLEDLLLRYCRNMPAEILGMDATMDHVLLLVEVDPKLGVYKFVKRLKKKTSSKLRKEFDLTMKVLCLWKKSYRVCTTEVEGEDDSNYEEYAECQDNLDYEEYAEYQEKLDYEYAEYQKCN